MRAGLSSTEQKQEVKDARKPCPPLETAAIGQMPIMRRFRAHDESTGTTKGGCHEHSVPPHGQEWARPGQFYRDCRHGLVGVGNACVCLSHGLKQALEPSSILPVPSLTAPDNVKTRRVSRLHDGRQTVASSRRENCVTLITDHHILLRIPTLFELRHRLHPQHEMMKSTVTFDTKSVFETEFSVCSKET